MATKNWCRLSLVAISLVAIAAGSPSTQAIQTSADAIRAPESTNALATDELAGFLSETGAGGTDAASCQASCVLSQCSAYCNWWQTAHCVCGIYGTQVGSTTYGVGQASCWCANS